MAHNNFVFDMSNEASPGFGSWLDDLAQAIPDNTIVGKAIDGNWADAATSAASWGQSVLSPTPAAKPPVTPKTLTSAAGGGLLAGTTGLLVVGGLAAFLLLKKKR